MSDRYYGHPFDGLPTSPDVTRLMKRWPDLQIGQYVDDKDIEEELGLERKGKTERRYETIMKAWIAKLQKDHKIVLVRQRAENRLKVLNAEEVADRAGDGVKKSQRLYKRRRHECATVQPETDEDRQRLLHAGQVLRTLEQSASNARKDMLKLPEPETNPKLRIAKD